MATRFLIHYQAKGHRALAAGIYNVDFQYTRDNSLAKGGLSTCKDLRALEIMPTNDRRGHSPKYICDAFGEIAGIDEFEKFRGFGIGLRCPANASCLSADLFTQQIASLQRVLDVDAVHLVGTCIGSWFAPPTSRRPGKSSDGMFWIYVMARDKAEFDALKSYFAVGNILDIAVTLQRIQIEVDSKPCQEYALLAGFFMGLKAGDIPRKGAGYTCDRLADDCNYCG